MLSEIFTFYLATFCAGRSDGVVVITSALHAEGREFDPRSDLHFVYVAWLYNCTENGGKLQCFSHFSGLSFHAPLGGPL